MDFKNQRYYSLCRYELDKKPSFIYEEVKDLFNHSSITISHIYTWSHQYRNERNEQKRGRLFEFDEFDRTSFENLKFELKSAESNHVKKIQFYALCRVQLNVKHMSIIAELHELFNVDAPDITTLNLWIKEFWKENDFNVSSCDSNVNVNQILYENSMLKEENHRLQCRLDAVDFNADVSSSHIVKSEPSTTQPTMQISQENVLASNLSLSKENLTLKMDVATFENNLSKMQHLLADEKKNNEKIIQEFNERILSLQIEKIKQKEASQIYELKYNQTNAQLRHHEQELIAKQNDLEMIKKEIAALRSEKEATACKQYEQFSLLEMRLSVANNQLNEHQKKQEPLNKLVDSIMNKNSNLRLENEKAIALVNQYISKLKLFEDNLKYVETQLTESKMREAKLKTELDKHGVTDVAKSEEMEINGIDVHSPIEFIDLTENVGFNLIFISIQI